MKLVTFFFAAMVPMAAFAQQTPVQQSTLPTLQQVLDQKSSTVFDAIAAFRGQIVSDQNMITTLSQENSDLTTKNKAFETQVNNLQAQLKAATAPAIKP